VDYSQQNTPQVGKSLVYITIVHPHHPMAGQRVRAVRQTGAEGERQWVIELEDQSHACIPLSWAEPEDKAVAQTRGKEATTEDMWADVTGLLKLARMVRNLRAFEPGEEKCDEEKLKESSSGHDRSGAPKQGSTALGADSSRTSSGINHNIDRDHGQAIAGPEQSGRGS
jgi:hypothetical protein